MTSGPPAEAPVAPRYTKYYDENYLDYFVFIKYICFLFKFILKNMKKIFILVFLPLLFAASFARNIDVTSCCICFAIFSKNHRNRWKKEFQLILEDLRLFKYILKHFFKEKQRTIAVHTVLLIYRGRRVPLCVLLLHTQSGRKQH